MWRKAAGWLATAALAGVVAASGVGGGGAAMAAKPQPPPPSGKWVYFNNNNTPSWRMAADGSDKTQLSGTVRGHVSDARYGGSYWSVWTEGVAGSSLPGDGECRYRIAVWPVETAGGPIEILNDGSWKPSTPAFRPGTTPRVTFSAVHWNGTSLEAGLYQIALTTDAAGAITGADPTTLESLVDGDVFTHVAGDVTYHWSQIQGHDWQTETVLVYGDDTFTSGGSLASQVYRVDLANPSVPPLALIAANQPRMVWGPVLSPSGTRVMYGNYTALYEVTVDGNATPTVFVAATSKSRGTTFDYLDDDWAVYGWEKVASPFTSDVYRKRRGGTAANLTGDVSTTCVPVAAR